MGLPNRDEIEGKFDQAKGKATEAVGRAINDEALEELRMLDQCLPVGHQHRDRTDGVCIANDLDKLIRTSRFPIRIGYVAAGDLQTAARALEATVRIDLLLHLRK